MWIMLIKKLPTYISPPKLSIFWSVANNNLSAINHQEIAIIKLCTKREIEESGYGWIIEKHKDQYELIKYAPFSTTIMDIKLGKEKDHDIHFYEAFGKRGDEINARIIEYKGEQIKVYPHEYSVPTPENLALYLFGVPSEGEPNSHELVKDSIAQEMLMEFVLETDMKEVYDAALLDGCSPNQAYQVCIGMDIMAAQLDIKPAGWYRCKREYAQIYCYDREMEE